MIKIKKKRLKLTHNLLTAGYNGPIEIYLQQRLSAAGYPIEKAPEGAFSIIVL